MIFEMGLDRTHNLLLEALGMGYFFLMTMDLSPTPQSSIYAPCPGGIGRGLLPQTIIDFPPTLQSSIYRLSAGGIGRGLLLLILLDANACRIQHRGGGGMHTPTPQSS